MREKSWNRKWKLFTCCVRTPEAAVKEAEY